MNAPLRLATALALGFAFLVPATALDWGGSLEESTSTLQAFDKPDSSSLTQTFTLKGWTSWVLGPGSTLLVKGNLSDRVTLSFAKGTPVTNTFSGDLDTLSWTTENWVVGRSDFRDFEGTLLSTKLDGVKSAFKASLAGIDLDLKGSLGTSALVFKSGSTVVISHADILDRGLEPSFAKPETLMAPPRLVGYVEAGLPRLVPDQNLRVATLLQLDLRPGTAKEKDPFDKADTKAKGAGVSVGYLGVGGQGRVTGPLYWSAATWLGIGSSLTPVGKSVPASPGKAAQFPTYQPNLILNGMVSADFTLLLPALNLSLAGLGVQAGSWDKDAATPDGNLAEGSGPSLYSGWFGVSRTGSALIFNPQLANLVLTKAFWSFKPFARDRGPAESLQTMVSALVFLRPTDGPIDETGLKPLGKGPYLGSEADLNLAWRPASDWGANLGLALFLPNGEVLNRNLELKAQLGLNLSF